MPPELLHADLLLRLGVPHAFTTRRGGVSSGPFASLNFGNPGELPIDQRDPRANIDANIRAVLAAIGCSGRELVEVHQVHGCAVHTVPDEGPAHAGPNDTRADALITTDRGRVIGVRVADCVPVLLAAPDGRVVAAVHAGWRGVVSGVVTRAVGAMRARGAEPAAICAAIGPCIGPEHFEVGDEVVAAFQKPGLLNAARPRPSPAGRTLLDLPAAIAAQLASAGVKSIETLDRCTVSDPELFFSHRRDRGLTGRMLALIGTV